MSWSLHIKIDPVELGDDIRAKLNAEFERTVTMSDSNGPVEKTIREIAGEQSERVINAVLLLVGAVARPQDAININLSGHYNKGKEPTTGWSPCSLSISLNQAFVEGQTR